MFRLALNSIKSLLKCLKLGLGGLTMARCKTIKKKDGLRLGIGNLPSFSITGSIPGMKKQYYGENALLVKCGSWIYNVTSKPEIYSQAH